MTPSRCVFTPHELTAISSSIDGKSWYSAEFESSNGIKKYFGWEGHSSVHFRCEIGCAARSSYFSFRLPHRSLWRTVLAEVSGAVRTPTETATPCCISKTLSL